MTTAHTFVLASIEMFGIIALLLEPASLHDPQKHSVQSEIWRAVITEAFPFIRSATSILPAFIEESRDRVKTSTHVKSLQNCEIAEVSDWL